MGEPRQTKPARQIYLALMAAFEAGKGLRLTAPEVNELGQDSAIVTRAAVNLPYDDAFVTDEGFTWTKAYRASLQRGGAEQ